MCFMAMDGIKFGVSGRRKKNSGLLLLLQQISAEEAEERTGERQWKREKVPHEVRALHTWTDAGSMEKRNVDPDGAQA